MGNTVSAECLPRAIHATTPHRMGAPEQKTISASVVSHGHGALVDLLVGELLGCPQVRQIVITQNIPEVTRHKGEDRVSVRVNRRPMGYGANHNAALANSTSAFFCILNPDIRLEGNPFPDLLVRMEENLVAASAPCIVRPNGECEDSARRFPTPFGLIGKGLGLSNGTYSTSVERQNPDWLAGMFLFVRAKVFRNVGGFDEKYFLYYEDVDLCWRLRRAGYKVSQVQTARAIHQARRASRGDWQHARWHLASMARFLRRSRKA